MDNVKNILSIDPFKTYLIGFYSVKGGTFTDQETGEVKEINLNRYELQIISPTDPEKWGASDFMGSAVSHINIPFDKAFAYFGTSPQEFSPEKFIVPLIGKPINLHTMIDGKGKVKLRGITLAE